MNKITIHEKEFDLLGSVIKKGAVLDFTATNKDNELVSLTHYKGTKVISVFPDINTSVCDKQTQLILKLSAEHKDVQFISITSDPVEVIAKWCASNGLANVDILSDTEGSFGKATNLLITEINKLARGFIVLNNENKIIKISINGEVAEMPDFTTIDEYLK